MPVYARWLFFGAIPFFILAAVITKVPVRQGLILCGCVCAAIAVAAALADRVGR